MKIGKLLKTIVFMLIVSTIFAPFLGTYAAGEQVVIPDMDSIQNSYYDDDISSPVYLFKYKGGKHELLTIPRPDYVHSPWVGMDSADSMVPYFSNVLVALNQVQNGRLLYSYDRYDSRRAYLIDFNKKPLKAVMANEAVDWHDYLLPNNYFVNKSPVGKYTIRTPDGSKEAVKLQFNYGKETVYTNWVGREDEDTFWDLGAPKIPQFVGLSLDYSISTKQYIMFYALSPYYGTDGSYMRKKPSKLRVAVFDKEGKLLNQFSLPDIKIKARQAITYPAFPPIDITSDRYDNITTYNYPIFFSPEEPNQIVTYVEDYSKPMKKDSSSEYPYQPMCAIMIDLTKGSYKQLNQKELSAFDSSLCLPKKNPEWISWRNPLTSFDYKWYYSNKKLPYKLEYRTTGTYIYLPESTTPIHILKGPYQLSAFLQDTDGTYYSIFEKSPNSSVHPFPNDENR